MDRSLGALFQRKSVWTSGPESLPKVWSMDGSSQDWPFLVTDLLRAALKGTNLREQTMERKKPIKKNHTKEFSGRMPRSRPRDKLGTSQGHLGHLGLIYV